MEITSESMCQFTKDWQPYLSRFHLLIWSQGHRKEEPLLDILAARHPATWSLCFWVVTLCVIQWVISYLLFSLGCVCGAPNQQAIKGKLVSSRSPFLYLTQRWPLGYLWLTPQMPWYLVSHGYKLVFVVSMTFVILWSLCQN